MKTSNLHLHLKPSPNSNGVPLAIYFYLPFPHNIIAKLAIAAYIPKIGVVGGGLHRLVLDRIDRILGLEMAWFTTQGGGASSSAVLGGQRIRRSPVWTADSTLVAALPHESVLHDMIFPHKSVTSYCSTANNMIYYCHETHQTRSFS